jgi:hypothetical protein
VCLKRRISHISRVANKVPMGEYKLVKLDIRRECVSYKGLRYGEQPKKRVALAQIVAN